MYYSKLVLRQAMQFRTQWTVASIPWLRHTVATLVAATLRVRHGTSLSRQPLNVRDQTAVAQLRTHGIAMLPDLIPDSTIDALLAYFQPREAMDKHGQLAPIAAMPVGTTMALYPSPTILASPDVLRVINNHSVLKIAAAYLGCQPTLSSIGVRWSLPGAATPEGTQRFHRDMEDFRFLRLFVYLTDVDVDAGPHVYVTKSHLSAGRLLKKFANRANQKRSEGDNIQTIVGGRGTAFIADTYGIHAGMVPTKTPRLILQVQYSLLPNYTMAYAPVPNTALSVDRYINRLLVRGFCLPAGG
jgi:hypothetical protein